MKKKSFIRKKFDRNIGFSSSDPGNRRVVWNNLIRAKKDDQAILLTSHSMAECDVLCSRLAIMVNGQFKCLGTPQHLKHRYGTGYYLKLRLEDEESIQIASNVMQQSLPDAIMTVRDLISGKLRQLKRVLLFKERHGTRLEYNIPNIWFHGNKSTFDERDGLFTFTDDTRTRKSLLK